MQDNQFFYANFIQWAHMRDNCYSSIKLYCNQLKSALVWSSFHSGKLSPTYSTFKIIQQKTGNKAVVDIDRYAIIPKLPH